MSERKKGNFVLNEALEFLNHLLVENPVVPFVIPLILVGWVIEKWIFSFSNWVPLLVAVWATIQVLSFSPNFNFNFLPLNWVFRPLQLLAWVKKEK